MKDEKKISFYYRRLGFRADFPKIFGIYHGRKIYPNLYIVIIAPPASGKGVMDFTKLLIAKIDEYIYSKSLQDIQDCQQQNKKEKTKNECPKSKMKIIPANISSSELTRYLNDCRNGILINESEADTLSITMKNEWGNYSDILRKAYHHEPISIGRKTDNIHYKADEPKLSVVISGTPNQLKELIGSTENGLYSRFTIYSFNDIEFFSNTFNPNKRNLKEKFEDLGDKHLEFYKLLEQLDEEIEFEFTNEQKDKFDKIFTKNTQRIKDDGNEGFISSLFRHGLMCFKFAMILTIIRNREKIYNSEKLICSNTDFKIALEITKTVINHSRNVYENFGKTQAGTIDTELLRNLNKQFTTQEAYKIGDEHNIKKRTIDDKLKQWQKKGYIEKVKHGHYKKI